MTAPQKMSFNDLENWLNQNRVTEVECLVPDLTGVARGKILPREKFTEDRGMRLPQAIVAMGVTGEFLRRALLRRDRADDRDIACARTRPPHASCPGPPPHAQVIPTALTTPASSCPCGAAACCASVRAV